MALVDGWGFGADFGVKRFYLVVFGPVGAIFVGKNGLKPNENGLMKLLN